jgi:hypothetical protein
VRLIILLVLDLECAMVRLTSHFPTLTLSMTEKTPPKYILPQEVPRESRGEASKALPEVVLEAVLEESSSVYWPKVMSKASSFAAIRRFAASITSFSADSWLEWKGTVVGVLSDRNNARR